MASMSPIYLNASKIEITPAESGVSLPPMLDFPEEQLDLLSKVIAVVQSRVVEPGECHIYKPEGASWKEAWRFRVVAFSDGALHVRKVDRFANGGRKRVYRSWLIQGERVQKTVELKMNGMFAPRDITDFKDDDALMELLVQGDGAEFIAPAPIRRFERPTKKFADMSAPVLVMARAEGTLRDLFYVQKALYTREELSLEEFGGEMHRIAVHLLKGFAYLNRFRTLRYDIRLTNFLYFKGEDGENRVFYSDFSRTDGVNLGEFVAQKIRKVLEMLVIESVYSGDSIYPGKEFDVARVLDLLSYEMIDPLKVAAELELYRAADKRK